MEGTGKVSLGGWVKWPIIFSIMSNESGQPHAKSRRIASEIASEINWPSISTSSVCSYLSAREIRHSGPLDLSNANPSSVHNFHRIIILNRQERYSFGELGDKMILSSQLLILRSELLIAH
jgi:hypothetical protein